MGIFNKIFKKTSKSSNRRASHGGFSSDDSSAPAISFVFPKPSRAPQSHSGGCSEKGTARVLKVLGAENPHQEYEIRAMMMRGTPEQGRISTEGSDSESEPRNSCESTRSMFIPTSGVQNSHRSSWGSVVNQPSSPMAISPRAESPSSHRSPTDRSIAQTPAVSPRSRAQTPPVSPRRQNLPGSSVSSSFLKESGIVAHPLPAPPMSSASSTRIYHNKAAVFPSSNPTPMPLPLHSIQHLQQSVARRVSGESRRRSCEIWQDEMRSPLPSPMGSPSSSPRCSYRPSPCRSPQLSPCQSPLRSPVRSLCPRRYKLVKELGRGSFGTVYECLNLDDGSFFAAKVCNSDQVSLEIQQEVGLLSQLNHPHIVRYLGTSVVDGSVYIFLELMKYSLQSVLNKCDHFEEDLIRFYTRQILLGLEYLHCKNTMHRDIKCANILVNVNGQVKLADFGVAKQVEKAMAASVKGTPFYMAPEIMKPSATNRSYGLPVDIWSLGCTVLEMADGKPPWSNTQGWGFYFRVCKGELPDIPEHLSDEGRDFILRCLCLQPEGRPTASELLRHPFVADAPPVNVTMEMSQPPSPSSMKASGDVFNKSWRASAFIPEFGPGTSIEGLRRNMNVIPSNLRTILQDTSHSNGVAPTRF